MGLIPKRTSPRSSPPGGRRVCRWHVDAATDPPDGAAIVRAAGANVFADAGLEALLDDAGVTTLVICGAFRSVETAAREACALGYQVFVVVDACGLRAERPSAGDAHPLVRLSREGARLVDTATALEAAEMAKARQRWRAERAPG